MSTEGYNKSELHFVWNVLYSMFKHTNAISGAMAVDIYIPPYYLRNSEKICIRKLERHLCGQLSTSSTITQTQAKFSNKTYCYAVLRYTSGQCDVKHRDQPFSFCLNLIFDRCVYAFT